jgi:NAD-dependent dihydropyrimidine dehydrogenase PreA subunit
VLTTLKYFKEEYEAHVHEGRCPAGVCKALITFSIRADKCTGCGRCRMECPVQCITGERKAPHVIETEACIKCGTCADVCKFDAVEVD